MDVAIQFAAKHDLVWITLRGYCDAAALGAAAAQMRADPRWTPEINRLWDFTEAQVDLSGDDIRRLAGARQHRSDSDAVYRLALVVGRSTAAYGLSRMFETHLDLANLPITFKVCKTLEEAWNWLGIEPPLASEAARG